MFCEIIAGREPTEKIFETADYLVIKNKFPKAPIHVLVMPKKHREKAEAIAGDYPGFWEEMIGVCWQTIKRLGLNKTGYKLVNNGAGYNHLEHEHLHILGGSQEEPGGET